MPWGVFKKLKTSYIYILKSRGNRSLCENPLQKSIDFSSENPIKNKSSEN